MFLNPVQAIAAPRFTLSPTSGSVNVGQNLSVIVGVNSEAEKVIGIDVAGSFDASKLEITSIEKANVPSDGYQFTFSSSSPIIHNDTGKFEITLPSADSSVYTGVVANHELLKINFRAKDTGTATVNFVCAAGSVTESNIINQTGSDVVDCATNQSGSYTIGGSSSGGGSNPTPTSTYATSAVTSSQLPRTGGVETTIGLMVFGIVTAAGAWLLRLI